MSDAFDNMKNLKEYKTNTNNEINNFRYSREVTTSTKHCLKDYVIENGRKIIDFLTGLGFFIAGIVFLVFIGAFIGSFFPDRYGNYSNTHLTSSYFLWAIIAPIVIVIITVISNYFMYLLIDIRDSLKSIEEKIIGNNDV